MVTYAAPAIGVALGGFMRVGKTTVGRRLAARLGWPFVDLDEAIAARFGPIARQFREDGEAEFRARERAVLLELCDGRPRVLATGGGTWADADLREALARCYRRVVLTAPLEVLERRAEMDSGGEDPRPLWAEAADRLWRRHPAYAEADLHVDVARRDPEAVVDAILRGLERPDAARVEVPLGERTYAVHVRPGGFGGLAAELEALGLRRVVVVSDSRVAPLWAPTLARELARAGIRAPLVCLPEGERHKGVVAWAALVDRLIARGVDRGTAVLALGGGVVGDVAGFAAATLARGVPVVQIPTTLLAMVDASVGGKTALDTGHGKNLVGAFHQPRLVWAGLQTLGTLPPRERRAGLGEVLKTALVADPVLFHLLEREAEALARGELDPLREVVERCVRAKAAVVASDEREAGARVVLNAGHTLAHAWEAALGYEGLRHGEAVALGLVAETRWAVAHGWCEDPDLPERLARLVLRLGLPERPPPVDRRRLLTAMGVDKKTRDDMLELPVPRRLGTVRRITLPKAELGQLLPELP